MLVDMPMCAPIQGKPLKLKYQCDCGTWAWPFQFDDVRGIAGIEGSFICDGCYTKLERNLFDINGDGKPKDIKAFKQRFLGIQGAPRELQAQVGKKLDNKGKKRK